MNNLRYQCRKWTKNTYNLDSTLILWNEGGIVPFNLFPCILLHKYTISLSEIFYHAKIFNFFFTYRLLRFVQEPIFDGIGPSRLFPATFLKKGKRYVYSYQDYFFKRRMVSIRNENFTSRINLWASRALEEYALRADYRSTPCNHGVKAWNFKNWLEDVKTFAQRKNLQSIFIQVM